MPNSGPKPLPEETAVAPQNSNSVIIGKYELGVVLAAGDFDCRTRLCKHLVTGVTYVVRIYSKSILNEGDNVWMRRRIKESIAVQRVLPKHKNVVDMVECWETEENVYILMNLFHSDNVVRLFTNPKSFYYYGSPNRRGSEFGAAMGNNNNNNNRTFSVTRRGTGSTRMDTMEDGNGRKSSAYEINHKVPRLSNFMHPEESVGTSQFQSRTNNNNNKAGVPDVSHIITLERIRDIFIKVVQGVLHLHHHSVAHTGIAPDHILIQLKADDKNNNNNSPTTSQKEKKEERFGQDDDEEEGEGKNLFNEANFLDQQVRISNLISCVYCPHPLNHRGHAQQTQAALLEEEEREAFYFAHCDDDLDRVGRHSSAQDPAYLLQRRRKKRLLMLNNKKGGNQLPEEKETSFNQDRQKSGLDEENFHKIKNELRGARSTVAPEILQQAEPYYDPFLADSWSLGVVFYFMLMRAKYPFDGANTLTHILYHHVRPMPTTRSTKSENDNFSNHQNIYNWMNHKNQLGGDSGKSGGKSGFIIPHVCVDLVSRLLQYSPTRRLTVEGILLHPFCFVADIWESESYFLRNANPVGNRDGFAAQLNMANNDRRGSMHGRAVRSFSQQRNSVVLQPSTSETIFSPAFPSDNNNNGSVENNMSNASSSNNNNNDSWGWDPLTDYISLRDHVSVNHPRGSSVYISKHPNNNNNNNNTMNNNGDEINVNNNSNWRRVSLFYNDPLVGVESKSATIIQRSFRIYRQRKVYYKINEMLNLASRIFFRRLYHNKELAEHKENNNKGEGDENGNNNTNENNKKETNDAGKGEGNISFDFSLEKENLLQFALKNKIISKYLYKQFYGNDTSTNGAVSNTENNNNNTTNNASQRRRSVRFNSSHSLNNNNNNNNNNNSMRRKPSITQKRLSFYQTKEKEANNNTNENENSVKEAENNTNNNNNTNNIAANTDYMTTILNVNFGEADPTVDSNNNNNMISSNNNKKMVTVARKINVTPYAFTSYAFRENHFDKKK